MTTEQAATDTERQVAARDLTFLARFFPTRASQRHFRAQYINWDRVIFARIDKEVVGQVSFFIRGKGPYRQSLKAFIQTFGWWRGLYAGIICQLIFLKFKRTDAYVYYVYVKPKYRGKGVASQLIDAVKQRFIEKGASSFAADIRSSNQASQKLMARAAKSQMEMAPTKRSIWQVLFKHLMSHQGKFRRD